MSAPLPPVALASYVIGGYEVADPLAAYDGQGRSLRGTIVDLLGSDWSFAGKRALDFGCGSGRVLRHFLAEAEGADFHGCDIDRPSIDWMADALSPPLHAHLTGAEPPLPFPDGYFDVAWTISVFSHLVETWSAWLLELHRVLAPGGLLIASVMGSAFSQQIAGEPWVEDRVGMNVLGPGRPWSAGGPMVLHSPWWIREHWGRAFEVLKLAPGRCEGQDAIVLRRRDVALAPADLERPAAQDPREVRALQHSLTRLQRAMGELNRSHDAYAAAYTAEVERRQQLETELARLSAEPQRDVLSRLRPRG